MIAKSSMNSIHNCKNPYQGSNLKVLVVCSAGLLRSPTLAAHLIKKYDWNARACGSHDYALIPISEALVHWADKIIFVNSDNELTVISSAGDKPHVLKALQEKSIVLGIEDDFSYNQPELVDTLNAVDFARLLGVAVVNG